MGRNRPVQAWIGVAGLLSAGCGASTWRFAGDAAVEASLTATPRPDWLSQPMAGLDERETIAAVGVGADATEAQERALTRLAQSLSVRIEASEVVREREAFARDAGGEGDGAGQSSQRSTVERALRSGVDAALLGASVDAMWMDAVSGRAYARAVASRALTADGLAARAQGLAIASAEWLALADIQSATPLDRLRRLSRASKAVQRSEAALLAAKSAAGARADLLALIAQAQRAVASSGALPASRAQALADEAKDEARAALAIDPFAPSGLETALRAGLNRLGLAVAARAPAAVEISLRYAAHALGVDADGQQRVGWRVALEVRDAQSGAVVGARVFEGAAAAPSHAEALATAAIAARRALRADVEDFLREAILGEELDK